MGVIPPPDKKKGIVIFLGIFLEDIWGCLGEGLEDIWGMFGGMFEVFLGGFKGNISHKHLY